MFGLNVVDAQFQYAMQANPSLHGAWMYVTYHPSSDPLVIPGRFTIRRVFDQSRTEVQKAEMDRLIRTWIPLGNYTINEQEDSSYPFSELLTEMEDRVELDPQFQGCMISGAYYGINRASFDKLDIVLRGRFADARQIDGIEQACAMLLRRNSAWLSKGLQTEKTGSMAQRPGGQAAAANNAPRYVDEDVQQRVSQLSLAVSLNARQLREVTPSGLHALELFHAGLGHFWRYQMEEAARSFRLAALEAPSQTDYLYWIMASDIALGRSDRAYQRMENLARFQRINPSEFRRVAWSLERLQGPIRLELLQLEARALGEVCRTRYLNPSLRRPMLQ